MCIYNLCIRWDFGVASLSLVVYISIYRTMIDIWSELKEAIGVPCGSTEYRTAESQVRRVTEQT